MKLNERLAEIQKELKAPKGQFNSFGKFRYRSCEDITEAVKPLLNGLTLVLSDEIVLIGERYYIKATATVSDGTEKISSTAFAREPSEKKGMDESMLSGATSSYARKYSLNGLFAIDDNKDCDSDEFQKEAAMGRETKAPPKAPPKVDPPKAPETPPEAPKRGGFKAAPPKDAPKAPEKTEQPKVDKDINEGDWQ